MEDLNDDILGLILERIDSHVSLVRAASTCKRWRRVIAGASFLRRYRSLHGPAVAGHYFNNDYPLQHSHPWFVPSSSIDVRHFSLDLLFLPWEVEPTGRHVLDSRGSLLLVYDLPNHIKFPSSFTEIVVCEPPTRRHLRIPPPPPDFFKNAVSPFCSGQYLLDGGDDVDDEAGACIGMSNFRVMFVFHRHEVAHAVVFTAGGGGGAGRGRLGMEREGHRARRLHAQPSLCRSALGPSRGLVVLLRGRRDTLVLLDGRTGEFSSSALPANTEDWDQHMQSNNYNFFVSDGRDGKPRIVLMAEGIMKVFVARLDDGKWVLEKKLLLAKVTHGLPGYKPSFFSFPVDVVTRGTGFVVLATRVTEDGDFDMDNFVEDWLATERWLFSIDLETMEVAAAEDEGLGQMAYRCELPWPPALQTCLDSNAL